MKIENESLGIAVDDSGGQTSLWSRRADGSIAWQARDCLLLAIRNPETDAITPVTGAILQLDGGMVCRMQSERNIELTLGLNKNRLMIEIKEQPPEEDSLPDRMRTCLKAPPLQILPGLFALDPDEKNSGFVLPLKEGVWIPSTTLPERAILRLYFCNGLSMGFWGACRPGSGTVVGLCDHAYLQFFMKGGKAGLSVTPEWLRDPQGITLKMEIVFLEGERPLDAAKEFRRHEFRHKRFKSLSKRATYTPALKNLIGGANIKFMNVVHRAAFAGNKHTAPRPESLKHEHCFMDVARICRELKAVGLDRIAAVFWGWGNQGYDRLHPDILPANSWAGGDEALACASKEIQKLGFTVGGHDNYQDIYEAAPSFNKGESVAVTPEGELHKGGIWAGGQCYLQCSREALRFARRNLPEMKARYGWDALFIDTITASPFYECYSEAHPRSREDDRRDKGVLMDESRRLFGVFGSEAGQAWGAEYMDYWEGILLQSAERQPWWLNGIPLPIFGAVYRDILIAYPHQSQGLHPDSPNRFLASLRSGQPPYYFFNKDFYLRHADYVRKTYEVLAHFHRQTVDEIIECHEWLTEDRRVEKTTFSGGAVVITNFSDTSYAVNYDGYPVRLAPWGFFVKAPGMAAFQAESLGTTAFNPALWTVLRWDERSNLVLFADRDLNHHEEQALRKWFGNEKKNVNPGTALKY